MVNPKSNRLCSILVLFAVLLSLILTGCQTKPVTEFTFTGYFNIYKSSDVPQDVKFPETMTIHIAGMTFSGTFRRYDTSDDYWGCGRYLMENTLNGFIVNSSGDVLSVTQYSAEVSTGEELSKEECTKIAQQIFQEMANQHSTYSLSDVSAIYYKDSDELEGYEVSFTKSFRGYQATDSARIFVDKYGNFRSFYSSNLGRVSAADAFAFDEDALLRQLCTHLSEDDTDISVSSIKYTVLPNGVPALELAVWPLDENGHEGEGMTFFATPR